MIGYMNSIRLFQQGCTLKEATIIASVLARTKIPVLHASAAMLRIAEMEYSGQFFMSRPWLLYTYSRKFQGPNSLFLRVLIDKKFELPYKVVDALVFHFIRLSNSYKAKARGDAEKLPVLWHQSLLVFAQRCAHLSLRAHFHVDFRFCFAQICIGLDPGPKRRAAGRHSSEPSYSHQPRDQARAR